MFATDPDKAEPFAFAAESLAAVEQAATAPYASVVAAAGTVVPSLAAAYEAAVAVGVGNAAVYQALRRTKGKTICPCCKQVVRDGFEIDRSVLKDSAQQ